MDYIYVNTPVTKGDETKLVTSKYPILSEDAVAYTVAFDTKNARIPRSRLADHKQYKTPVNGFYFPTERTALEHAVYTNNKFEYDLVGRIINDLTPYVTAVALGKIQPETHEEEYHLWGKTLKATVDELVRIFDKLKSLGFPPAGMTVQQLALWLDILGYDREEYPTIYTRKIDIFISDLQLLDELTGSREGMTTEEYEEKRRYTLRKILKAAIPARERHKNA